MKLVEGCCGGRAGDGAVWEAETIEAETVWKVETVRASEAVKYIVAFGCSERRSLPELLRDG